MPSLLASKLSQPSQPSGLHPRPLLLARLKQGLQQRGAVLLCCPAGYGKTSLALQLLQDWPSQTSWLRLDEMDAQPQRFATYLAAALELPAPWVEAGGQLDISHQISLMLCQLTNQNRLLVIDNCQYLQSEQLQQALALLIQYRPNPLQLLLLSRTEPQIGLVRLELNQQLQLFSERELAFQPDEVQQWLGEHIAPAQQPWLDACQGWPAALQLVSLKRCWPHQNSLVSSGVLHDYLASEILLLQPELLQQLMLMTASARQFNRDLANHLLGQDSSGLLDELQRQHLLQPLDGQALWFGYPKLLQEFLQQECQRRGANLWSQSHWLCQNYWLQQGQYSEALHHGLQHGSIPALAQLLSQVGEDLLEQGQSLALLQGLNLLPNSLLRATPELCRLKAEVLLARHDPCSVEAALHSCLPAPPEVAGQFTAIQAQVAAAHEDFALAQQLILAAQEPLAIDPASRSRCEQILSLCAINSADYPRARQHAQRQLQAAQQADSMPLMLNGHAQLARIELLQGNFLLCIHEINEAHARAVERRQQHSSQMLSLWLVRAQCHWLANEIELANSLIQEAHGLLQSQPSKEKLPWLLLQLKLAQSQRQQAALLPLALQVTELRYASLHPRRMALIVDAALAEVAWQYPQVQPHAQNPPLSSQAELSQKLGLHAEMLLLIQALEAWNNNPKRAQHLLLERYQLAHQHGIYVSSIDSLLYLTRLARNQAWSDASHYWQLTQSHPLFDSVPGLIASHQLDRPTQRPEIESPLPAVVQSMGLTPREWQVLLAIGAGDSNDSISQQLGMELSTLKTHINRLYHKLQITKRQQARQQAKQLLLLSQKSPAKAD